MVNANGYTQHLPALFSDLLQGYFSYTPTEEQLEQFVADNTTGKVLGIFGEETVNVLGVNLDIAEALGLIGGVD